MSAASLFLSSALPSHDAALPSASSSRALVPLRLGTLNIGLGISRKLVHIVARCAELELDVLALQEIGDPALLSTRLSDYQLIYSPGLSHHQAGVGLLLALPLIPRVRRYLRSTTGRLVAAVLELTRGRQLLLASAYMPSGLDHSSADSDSHELAHKLYDELLRWSVGMQEVVVMGDLNETLTHWDRQPSPPPAAAGAAAPASAPIAHLQRDGFIDVYRHLHSDASLSPGFTHFIDGMRPSRSRIDYIWSRGVPAASLLRVHIDSALASHSHHRLLWTEMQLLRLPVPACSTSLLKLRLPDLRSATDQHKSNFINHIEASLLQRRDEFESLASACTHTDDALHHLASSLTEMVHHSAAAAFPMTGRQPGNSGHLSRLQQQRRTLTRLLHIAHGVMHSIPSGSIVPAGCLIRCPEWLRLFHLCQQQHPQLLWHYDAWTGDDPCAWIAETRVMLNRTRKDIRKEVRRMARSDAAADAVRLLNTSPAAAVHRMLKSDALPSQLTSMVDNKGELTSSAAELEAVLVDHFRSVFAVPPADPAPLHPPPPAMLLRKESVQEHWWRGLIDSIDESEIVEALADTKFVSAPGEDGVSTGLWKLALQGSGALRLLVSILFSHCLGASVFPHVWKTSVIVPLIKDEKKERTASNVRPISLQSCLGKLFMKVLAHRLGRILSRFPILNPAQRGFILGGSITKCIDELLDAWDVSRTNKSELYTLFYDIKQAYDSVERDVLMRAMRRLCMPESFVALVADSMTGLSSCVRTAFGVSHHFAVERSLRQGCPLAPVLFVILMDALHDGLELNPFTGQRAGLQLQMAGGSIEWLPSSGFADDTKIHANNLSNLRTLNDWVHYFMRFNRMLLNPAKCELVGRSADGQPVTAAAIAAAGITVAGHALVPVEHSKPIRYLGVWCRFDGDWQDQHNKLLKMIYQFTRLVSKFRLSVSQASYVYNTFLLPKLELGLRYIHGPHANDWIRMYDKVLVGSIKHAAGSLLQLSYSAVALVARFCLPSWLEIAIKTSELFIRMNSLDCRWSRIGRQLMRQQVGAVVDRHFDRSKNKDSGTRLQRAAAHAVNHLQWTMQLREEPSRAGRHQHLFARPLAGPYPDSSQSSGSSVLQLDASLDSRIHVAHDCWTGWNATAAPARIVHVYTDGSFDASSVTELSSSWAVTVRDEWLSSNFAGLPTDEHQLTCAHVGGATLFGASIACTSGVYAAELQAIARALAMFPASFTLHIHSDSQGALAGIRAYEQECNARRRLRMSARPLLQLIAHLIDTRRKAGGDVHWHHVKAHSQHADIDSVGNRLTDWQANRARAYPDRPQPAHLLQLPLGECEHYLSVQQHPTMGHAAVTLQLIDDVRCAALARLKANALMKWSNRRDPPDNVMHDGAIACAALLDLSKVVMAAGSPSQQATLIHVATNSIHCIGTKAPDGTLSRVLPLRCTDCINSLCTLSHLAECAGAHATQFRADLKRDIFAVLESAADTASWRRQFAAQNLQAILLRLFPNAPDSSADEQQLHFTRLLCGAFSARQANVAARSLGFSSVENSRLTLQQIRCTCLDRIAQVFRDLKSAAAP